MKTEQIRSALAAFAATGSSLLLVSLAMPAYAIAAAVI
ncbi:hypothetical protein FHS50_001780 [Sphingomicrobium lutaoense]|uniref:Uncharacterized protein n=1 Tax=Sphingomicrobium lutaoense TaxID=515949 RepID=A0A839Z2D7_9SPHN|nr:hypothetical protein [Sphingomicrobium lutaoense]